MELFGLLVYTKDEAEAYEQKLVALEKKLSKAEKTNEQNKREFNNVVNKVQNILDSDMGVTGTDWENDIPDKQVDAIRETLRKYFA